MGRSLFKKLLFDDSDEDEIMRRILKSSTVQRKRRRYIERDHLAGHKRLYLDYFADRLIQHASVTVSVESMLDILHGTAAKKGRKISGWLPGSPTESFTKACLVDSSTNTGASSDAEFVMKSLIVKISVGDKPASDDSDSEKLLVNIQGAGNNHTSTLPVEDNCLFHSATGLY